MKSAVDTQGNRNAAACMVPPHFDAVNHQHAILEDAVDRIEEAHQLHGAENNLNGYHMNNGADSSDVDLHSTVDADDIDNISDQDAVSDSDSYDVPSASDEDASNFGSVHDQSDYDWLEVDNNEEKLRMIKLRLGPVLLCHILPDNLNDHFLLFHVAMELLSNEQECVKPENLVRKSAKPLQQIVKRLSELEMASLVEPYMENQNFMVLEDEHFSGPILPNMQTEKQFKRAKKFEAYDDLYLLPVKSRQLGIHVVKQLGSLNKKTWKTETDIQTFRSSMYQEYTMNIQLRLICDLISIGQGYSTEHGLCPDEWITLGLTGLTVPPGSIYLRLKASKGSYAANIDPTEKVFKKLSFKVLDLVEPMLFLADRSRLRSRTKNDSKALLCHESHSRALVNAFS
ncbi:hypothetical protein OUZ56_029716 [Daphnia magna]|uniref:Uncharacterized protein n=1 Tax=Daphnia magna TaxID=35525 RepID=A0ABR0B7M2_9CRUS|nr:hypothetical protein OUZ56_029716 [Daphnia magna]